MQQINKSIQDIKQNSEKIARDYLRLISLRVAEKLSYFLGIMATLMVLSLLSLIVFVFGSFALAVYLNRLLQSDVFGFLIVGGVYVFTIAFILWRTHSAQKPLFSRWFVKFILSFLEIDVDNAHHGIDELKTETQLTEIGIEINKNKVKADLQILPTVIWDSIVNEVLSFFMGWGRAGRKRKKRKKAKKADRNENPI